MDRLVEPAALAATPLRPDQLLVQVTSAEVYAAGHIPGAVLVEPRALVSGVPPARGQLPPLARLRALFGGIGYHPDLEIIAYDDEGGGWAGRFIWTLDVIGHHRWRYLDGGLPAWRAAGLELTRESPAVSPSDPPLEIDPAPIADAEDILPRLREPSLVIWDARSLEEYTGRKVTAARGGHIPGAVHLDWLELMDPERSLRLRGGLETLLRDRGITPNKEVITHCQTHHRSGLSYMVARCLGYPRISAYHGSWSDWGNRRDTPVETGPPG